MHVRRTALRLGAALGLVALALVGSAPASRAATREPLRDALARALGVAQRPARAVDSAPSPRPAALRSMLRESADRYASAGDGMRVYSDAYGAAELEPVAATLRSLDHGPELAELSVFVATPEQVGELCGEEALACYFGAVEEMVVSGVDAPVDGVSREFAIAHEYGHHIANSQGGGTLPAIEAGTLRWATYERVCQLTRHGRLSQGDSGARYWQDPEEAFAQAYAVLNRPADRVPWDYTPLLQPSAAALAKIHADVSRPWTGPVRSRWEGPLSSPPGDRAGAAGRRSGAIGVGAGHAVGDPPWLAVRHLRTPLDGAVSVSVRAAEGSSVAVTLRDRDRGRVLARVATGPEGSAEISYANCGADALRVEVRALDGPAAFEAELTRP